MPLSWAICMYALNYLLTYHHDITYNHYIHWNGSNGIHDSSLPENVLFAAVMSNYLCFHILGLTQTFDCLWLYSYPGQNSIIVTPHKNFLCVRMFKGRLTDAKLPWC